MVHRRLGSVVLCAHPVCRPACRRERSRSTRMPPRRRSHWSRAGVGIRSRSVVTPSSIWPRWATSGRSSSSRGWPTCTRRQRRSRLTGDGPWNRCRRTPTTRHAWWWTARSTPGTSTGPWWSSGSTFRVGRMGSFLAPHARRDDPTRLRLGRRVRTGGRAHLGAPGDPEARSGAVCVGGPSRRQLLLRHVLPGRTGAPRQCRADARWPASRAPDPGGGIAVGVTPADLHQCRAPAGGGLRRIPAVGERRRQQRPPVAGPAPDRACAPADAHP